MPSVTLKSKTYSLCEAVADIAYIAGEQRYYGGDSRADIADFISWAQEFEYTNRRVNWGDDADYISAIQAFAEKKLRLYPRSLSPQ